MINDDRSMSRTDDVSSPLPLSVPDLRYAYCWVCSEEEVRDTLAGSLSSSYRTDGYSSSRSRFVHPCKCSLVAHEKVSFGCSTTWCLNLYQCLLSWIRQCNRNKPGEPIVCPQCKEPYQLEQPRSIALSILNYVNNALRSFFPVGASAIALAGIWIAAAAHGSWSVRMFFGERVASRLLISPWPSHVR